MTEPLSPSQRLDDIDARQDEVLRQLDDLAQRIEQALAQFAPQLLPARVPAPAPVPVPPGRRRAA